HGCLRPPPAKGHVYRIRTASAVAGKRNSDRPIPLTMGVAFGCQSMVAPLRAVIVKRPEEAFRSKETIDVEWKVLGYTRPPDLVRACDGHRQFVSLLSAAGAKVLCLPADDRTGLDSLYTHDPVLITNAGAVIFQTGKKARRG